MDDAARFGRAFKRHLDESGMTLRGLAGKVNVTAAYLSAISTGKAVPSMSRTMEIIKALGVDEKEFLREAISPAYRHGQWQGLVEGYPHEAAVLMSNVPVGVFSAEKLKCLQLLNAKLIESAESVVSEAPWSVDEEEVASRSVDKFIAHLHAFLMLLENMVETLRLAGHERQPEALSSKGAMVGMLLGVLENRLRDESVSGGGYRCPRTASEIQCFTDIIEALRRGDGVILSFPANNGDVPE